MVLLNQQYNEKQKQFLHRKPRTLGYLERIISPWYLWRVVRNLQGGFDGRKTPMVMTINPLTGKETLVPVKEQCQMIYKGVLVTAMQEYYQCTETGEQFYDTEMGERNIEAFKANYNQITNNNNE